MESQFLRLQKPGGKRFRIAAGPLPRFPGTCKRRFHVDPPELPETAEVIYDFDLPVYGARGDRDPCRKVRSSVRQQPEVALHHL
jgi:hypothetical protein